MQSQTMPANSALWQSEIGLTRLPEDDELYILWSQFWGKAFAYDSDGDGVGNGIKVLSLSAPLPGPSRIRKVLMRDEYLRCLKDAERFFRTPKPEPFLTEDEEEDQGVEDDENVGASLNESNIEKVDRDDGNVQERLAKGLPEDTRENIDVGEISGNHQRVEDVGSLTGCKHPPQVASDGSEKVDVMKDPMMNAAAFVVIGHPGIGKTIGLWIALFYCFTRCRPVVFQYELKDIFFFSADGAFKTTVTPTPRVWNRYIPDSTWCLVDTNPHFGFEQSITTIGRCILQTCSPRKERISWMSKHEGVRMIWIMKPMSLSEEQTCVKVLNTRISNEQVERFYNTFGSTTRNMLCFARSNFTFECYEREVSDAVAGIASYDTLKNIINRAKDLDYMANDVLHKIVLVEPGRFRHQPCVSIVSRHVLKLLTFHAAHAWKEGAHGLYELTSAIPNTAAHIYEAEIHDEIANGGVWSIRKMERATLMVEEKTTSKRKRSGEILPSKKRRTGKQGTGNEEEVVADADEENSKPNRILYKINERVPAKFLEIDQDLVLKITDDEPGDQHRLTPGVKVYDYREALTMILNSQYYRPKFPNQATFDSFIYDEGENTVTVFQVTIAPSHDVKLSNKAWWTSLRGANTSEPPKFDYVVVTTDAMVKLEVTRPAASFFRYFYHMCIPADDVFAKQSA